MKTPRPNKRFTINEISEMMENKVAKVRLKSQKKTIITPSKDPFQTDHSHHFINRP